jgi:tripartite-type tricarboxylate transporter receptor subunit TctC
MVRKHPGDSGKTNRSVSPAALCFSLILLAPAAGPAQQPDPAAQYPQRPIRMIVPFAPGGSVDIVARLIAGKLSASLNQQVIVDNRGGGGGNIAAQMIAQANPDGYTLMTTISNIVTNPAVNPRLDYDPLRDFTPVLLFGRSPFRIVVNPKVPANTIQEWFALVKSRPGTLNYGSAGSGTGMHLTVELFKIMTKIDIVHVPYKGTGPAMIDLIGGQIQMMFAGTLSSVAPVKAGRIRALAVTSLTRRPESPEQPTVAETILPGYEASEWFGVVAPGRMPKPLLARIHSEVVRAVHHPETRERLLADGMDVLTGTPEQFGQVIKDDLAKWRRVVKETKITAD